MGSSAVKACGSSNISAADDPDDPEAVEELAALPPPCYDDGIWMASCRPANRRKSMSTFAPVVFLFQPDCRLFCNKGTSCKLLRGPAGQVHRELFIHTTRRALLLAAEVDLASRSPPTLVENASEITAALPHVPHCWSLETPHTHDITMLPETLRTRPVIVWVHGFKTRYFRVVNVSHHLYHLSGKNSNDLRLDGGRPCVISFLWPCHKRRTAYAFARRDANHAGMRLKSLLLVLQALDCQIVVVAHSLGCRVALHALLDSRHPEAPIKHLVLLGAAVPTNALSSTGDFPRERVAAEQVTVLSSKNDEVLGSAFQVGEAVSGLLRGQPQRRGPAAMGLNGPELPLPPGTSSADVTETVASHNPNLWFMSPSVMSCIVSALTIKVQETPAVEGAPAAPVDPMSQPASQAVKSALAVSADSLSAGEANHAAGEQERGLLSAFKRKQLMWSQLSSGTISLDVAGLGDGTGSEDSDLEKLM